MGYWLALEALARRAYPHAQWVLIGDCGTSAGVAMQAMRDGMRAICCDVAPDVEVKLRAIAVQTQVHFVIPSELTGEVPCFISAASID